MSCLKASYSLSGIIQGPFPLTTLKDPEACSRLVWKSLGLSIGQIVGVQELPTSIVNIVFSNHFWISGLPETGIKPENHFKVIAHLPKELPSINILPITFQ